MDRIDSYKKALLKLKEILNEPETEINRDAAIKRFEFTVELAWKCIQQYLRDQGIVCRSPKECLKEAFKFGLIEDDPLWFGIFEDRNLTAHTYDEETADEVYKRLPEYLGIFNKLNDSLKRYLK